MLHPDSSHKKRHSTASASKTPRATAKPLESNVDVGDSIKYLDIYSRALKEHQVTHYDFWAVYDSSIAKSKELGADRVDSLVIASIHNQLFSLMSAEDLFRLRSKIFRDIHGKLSLTSFARCSP